MVAPRSIPLWPRYLWHPTVHVERARERLYFYRLQFRPFYQRDEAEAGVRAACAISGVLSICAYTLLGSHDLLVRVWLPEALDPEEFRREMSNQLDPNLAVMEVAPVIDCTRHFGFQDENGASVEPESTYISSTAATTLSEAEECLIADDISKSEAFVDCWEHDLIVDLRDFTRRHSDATVTFVTYIAAPEMLPAGKADRLGDQIIQVMDGLRASKSISQMSLYRVYGFASYILMGRIEGPQFHDLHRYLVMPINLLSVTESYAAHTVTGFVAQRGLLIAEERLTGLGTNDPSVWSQDEAQIEPSSTVFVRRRHDFKIGGRFETPGETGTPVLGSGGSSDVLRVRDTFEGVDRALKLFHADESSSAFGEANILRNNGHPGIVRYYFLGRHRDQFFVVMELIEGYSLRELLNESSHLFTIQVSIDVLIAVLDALASIHPNDFRREQLRATSEQRPLSRVEADELMGLMNMGLIHRDIKPENIMQRSETGEIVLVDFGIASQSGRSTKTRSGTPDYMAPDAGVDGWRPEDDIYACGVVLYELITHGRLPYRDDRDVVVSEPVALEERCLKASGRLSEVVMRACSAERHSRFDSAAAFANELKECLSDYMGGSA